MAAEDHRFEQRVAGAFARNGLNTLLLDIKGDLAAVTADLRHIMREQDDARDSRRLIHETLTDMGKDMVLVQQAISTMQPKLTTLDDERREKIGQRAERLRLLGYVTRGRVIIGAAAGGSLGALWHAWEDVRHFVHKLHWW